jgi:putative tricarboxylic transport membrane protein
VYITAVPAPQLYTCVLALMVVGALSLNEGVFPAFLLLIFGVIGYLMNVTGYNPICAVLGFVLEQLIETNFRRALMGARGDFMVFFTSPISLTLLVLTCISIYLGLRNKKKQSTSKA